MITQPAKLREGAGDGKPEDGLCLMQMVDWFSGTADNERLTDKPACACPVLTTVGIKLNDTAPSQQARDALWPLVWQLLGSRDKDAEQRRAEHIVREVTHRIVAPLFDAKYPDHAAALRLASTMKDVEAAATAAARAARAAEAAAWAAVWAAEAAAWAAEAAAWAAKAAAWAAKAKAKAEEAAEAAEEAWAWSTLRDIFVEAIALGAHGEEDPVYAPRAEQLTKVLCLSGGE